MDKRVILASAAAIFFWGVAGIGDKMAFNSMPDLSPITAQWVRFLVATITIATISASRKTLMEFYTVPKKAYRYILIGAFGGLALGSAAYFYAVKMGEVSTAAVFVAGYPLITVLLAVPFLKEKMSWRKIMGMALVVAGLIVVASGSA